MTKDKDRFASANDSGAHPILTILIPTYNRASRPQAIVGNLTAIIDRLSGLVELVVSDNGSSDDTFSKLQTYGRDNIRIERQAVHLSTVEEHIFNCLDFCRGQYIWFLGDDDVPQHDTIIAAVELLRSGTHDFLIFNSITVNAFGTPTGAWIAPSDTDLVQVDFTDGATALGYTFSIAGISNAIMRKAPLAKTDWRAILQIQTIYSHVAWWLVAFSGQTMTVVNSILVYYRIDQEDIIHRFTRHMVDNNMPDYAFWTTGIVKQLIYVEKHGGISPRHIYNMFEQRQDGSYSRMLDNIVALMWAQVSLAITEPHSNRNHVSEADLKLVVDWILRADPSYYEITSLIGDLHAMTSSLSQDAIAKPYVPSSFARNLTSTGEKRLAELTVLFQSAQAGKGSTAALVCLVSRYSGFAIYRHITGFVAFDDATPYDRQHILRKFYIAPQQPTLLVARTEEELKDHILMTRAKQATREINDRADRGLEALERLLTQQIADLRSQVDRITMQPNHNATPVFDHMRLLANGFGRIVKKVRAKQRASREPFYFDRAFYLERYEDVRKAGIDPYQHFLRYGAAEGRMPNALFQPAWYIKAYMEHHDNYSAALDDFVLSGLAQGRRPNPFSTAAEHLARYPLEAQASR